MEQRPTREEARRRLLRYQQERLDQHARAPGDATWSRGARDAFGADFAALTREQPFTVRDIDCRSHTCVTTLEWPSYAEAVQGHAHLLRHPFAMDCTRSILLPEPEDPTARYQARLFLDCAGPP
ncbi:hypothetical protein [Archangium primigenium]|uniref:hypothetical protein n=1 Tax=[Archangium] primigenium TaxID=2792470 RepID=UPI00195776D0|nr:hypothetical protein [Archangium primigenium]MBM7119200.1 hypothetical protein [Archangium primigenium]